MARVRRCPFCQSRLLGAEECHAPACTDRLAKSRAEPEERDGMDGLMTRIANDRPQTGGGHRVVRDPRGLS